MSLVRAVVLSAAFGCAAFGALFHSERAAAAPWSSEARLGEAQPTARPGARADTLRYQVRAGQTLLVSLPGRAGNVAASYQIASAPAMSWLVDRSFMWRTIPTERGLIEIVIRQTAAPDDDLILMVEVTE